MGRHHRGHREDRLSDAFRTAARARGGAQWSAQQREGARTWVQIANPGLQHYYEVLVQNGVVDYKFDDLRADYHHSLLAILSLLVLDAFELDERARGSLEPGFETPREHASPLAHTVVSERHTTRILTAIVDNQAISVLKRDRI